MIQHLIRESVNVDNLIGFIKEWIKSLITFVLVVVFILYSGFVQAEQDTESRKVNWISGVVESIEQGPANSLVTVTLPYGEDFNFSSTNDKLKGIQTGDSVSAKVVKGWAETIDKPQNK